MDKSSSNLFWEKISDFFENSYWKLNPDSVSQGIMGIIYDHPEIMRHLLGKWEYDSEDSIRYLLKKGKNIK